MCIWNKDPRVSMELAHFLCPIWARSELAQPISEPVTYVTASLIGWARTEQARSKLKADIEIGPRFDIFFYPQANKWCSRGMELLSCEDLEGYETLEEAEAALQETQEFLNSAEELRLNNPKEFRQMFDSMITPETRVGQYNGFKGHIHP